MNLSRSTWGCKVSVEKWVEGEGEREREEEGMNVLYSE